MRIVLHTRARLDLAYDSLDGLSVGDALGVQFFMVGRSLSELVAGRPPAGPWEWTDDTEMACNLVTELRDHGEVGCDRLARLFADRCEPYRGYGAGAFVILHKIRDGVPWREAAGRRSAGRARAATAPPCASRRSARTSATTSTPWWRRRPGPPR